MEWGSFDDTKQVLPLTQFDVTLDRESVNPGKQVTTACFSLFSFILSPLLVFLLAIASDLIEF